MFPQLIQAAKLIGMIKYLNGSDLAGFIKERHARQVRGLRSNKIIPKLAIVQVKDDPAIDVYVSLKQKYGADIGVDVEVHKPTQSEVPKLLDKLNKDESTHGIIIQLPLTDATKTDEIVDSVDSKKDVDALGKNAKFEPATPNAVLWLLAGYNINLAGKKVLLIGRGKLVGAPLEKILKSSGIEVVVVDGPTDRLAKMTEEADIIIAAASTPEILHASMIKPAAVVVDAGVAGEDLLGNVAPDVYKRDDITITPQKGGVGPLTVCALFENLIRAASAEVKNNG
jgi:methylenetetrahydrofolate dehydrogenase (NADP+)/methenyltetrahydrofolate cyclohydrolase